MAQNNDLRAFDAGLALARLSIVLQLGAEKVHASEIALHATNCMSAIGCPFTFVVPEDEAERNAYLLLHFGTKESTIYRFQTHVSEQMGERALAAFEVGFLLTGVSLPPGPEANTIRRHLTRLNVSDDVVDMFNNLNAGSLWDFIARLRDRIDRTARIFISYRRVDGAAYARLIWFYLQSLGHDVFLDVETLKAHKYGPEIVSAIQDCNVFLPILSPSYFERVGAVDDWVRQEIECAIAAKKLILPIQVGERPTRTDSSSELEKEVMQYNVCHLYHVDFHGFAKKLQIQLKDCITNKALTSRVRTESAE